MKNNKNRRGGLIGVHWFLLCFLSLILISTLILLKLRSDFWFYIWDTECLAPILISAFLALSLILLICKKPFALRLLELSLALLGGFLLFEAFSIVAADSSYKFEAVRYLMVFNPRMGGLALIIAIASVFAGHFISGFYRKNASLLFYGRDGEKSRNELKFTELTELFGALAAAFVLALAGLLYDASFDIAPHRISFSYFYVLLLPAAVFVLLYVLLRLRKEAAMPVLLILNFVLLPLTACVIFKYHRMGFYFHIIWLLGFMALAVYAIVFFRKNAGELFKRAELLISDESLDYTLHPSLSKVKRADLRAALRSSVKPPEDTQIK